MTEKAQVILGITPINIRLAYQYMKRGIGWHAITHPYYDQVHVSEVQEWQELPGARDGVKYGSLMRVAFYLRGQQIRYIDFSIICTGGGGEPALKTIYGQGN